MNREKVRAVDNPASGTMYFVDTCEIEKPMWLSDPVGYYVAFAKSEQGITNHLFTKGQVESLCDMQVAKSPSWTRLMLKTMNLTKSND